MALARTPLDPAQLPAAVQRALAPGPGRLMAARGLAPLTEPRDLITVLYQLALDSDAAIRQAAVATARDLPDRVLGGALSDERVDPRVLDYFAEVAAGAAGDTAGQAAKEARGRPESLQRVVLNRATADDTVAWLAGRGDQATVDLIAQNEQRLLRHPEIIAAMFHNPRARMSTVDRAIELAVRNQIKVPGIPSWDGLAAAVLGTGPGARAAISAEQADAMFSQATEPEANALSDAGADAGADADEGADAGAEASAAPRAEPERAGGRMPPVSSMSLPMKIRLATLGNAFVRSALIRDPNRMVAGAAIKAPGVSDIEAARYAGNHSLSDDVIKYIAGRRDWTKTYGVKLSLIQNPKTPIPDAIRFMPHLRERDLRAIARSKNVPTAVVAQARKLLLKRGPAKK